jgi:hypothetical protein
MNLPGVTADNADLRRGDAFYEAKRRIFSSSNMRVKE